MSHRRYAKTVAKTTTRRRTSIGVVVRIEVNLAEKYGGVVAREI